MPIGNKCYMKKKVKPEKKLPIQFLLITLFLLFLGAITLYKPSITGFVPLNVYTQDIELVLTESGNFILSTDAIEPFVISSFRISGEIIGNGQVNIAIDTGRGQKIVVYKNLKDSSKKGGFTKITGRVMRNIKQETSDSKAKWLVIKPIKPLLEREVFEDVNDTEIKSGVFEDQCIQSCTMSMEMSRDVNYRLVFLVEKGTTLKVNKVTFVA